jgi:siroheme synthase
VAYILRDGKFSLVRLADQRTAAGELHQLGSPAQQVGSGPALILIGEVVRHAEAWAATAPPLAVAN